MKSYSETWWDQDVASSYLSGFVELLLQARYRHGGYTVLLAGDGKKKYLWMREEEENLGPKCI